MLRSILTRLSAKLRSGAGHLSVSQAWRFDRLVRDADALRDARDYEKAAAGYAAALQIKPSRTDLRVQLGNMLKDSGAYAAAEAAYRAALAVRPNDYDIHLQLAHSLTHQGRRAEALASYRQAVALNPVCAEAVGELAAAGEPGNQLVAFEAQLRGHGAETLLHLSAEVAAMRARLDQIGAALPEPSGWAAFPVATYGVFRSLFDVPSPPVRTAEVVVVLQATQRSPAVLYQQLAALREQSHPNWRLIVTGTVSACEEVVVRAAAADARIVWQGDATPRIGDTDWVLLLGEGALLHRHAIGWVVHAATLGSAEVFVCDEAVATVEDGRTVYLAAELRAVPDAETLRQANVWGDTVAIRADAFNSAVLSADDYLTAAAARSRAAHIPLPLVWRMAGDRPRAPRRTVSVAPEQTEQRITVIIPTRDNAEDVAVLAGSLRRLARRPGRLSIVVVVTAGAPEIVTARLAALAADGQITLTRFDEPFNWSRLNNLAAEAADADIVVFANDDMRMLTRDWDDRLRVWLARPDVGAVGVRLLYEDNTIQHAGILLGWRGGTIHDGLYEPADAPGPASRWQVAREVGAVTGAFLATRREVLLSMGGFDAQELPIGYSDVDYALKLRVAGLKVIWTPDITLYHHESKTRGLDHLDPARLARDAAERAVMRARWGEAMDFDPGVNPYWHDASLPFRLLAPVSLARLERYMAASASGRPWHVKRLA